MIWILSLIFPLLANDSFFFEDLESTVDVPFVGPTVTTSRLKMLEAMGRNYPGLSCAKDCHSREPDVREACELGLIGGVHLITSNQYSSGRAIYNIWRYPNSSLTVDAYAFMLEYEAGLSCEKSRFVKKFPTRQARLGERPIYLDQKDVCQAWHNYFEVANDPKESDRQKLHHLWRAHGLALYHSYWQYADAIGLEADLVPKEEYDIWISWSRFVGLFTPKLLRRSCGSESYPLARVLMPKCIFGNKKPNGKNCRLSKGPRTSHLYWETRGFLWVRKFLVTEQLDDLMESFESGLKLPRTRFHNSQ